MKLVFAGDFCPFDGCAVEFCDSIKNIFSAADYAFVNLECPLTNETTRIDKCGPNLKASPKQIAVLKDLGANGVTLANNHLLDYGGGAVLETLRICKDNGIKTVGAGENIDAARKILTLEKDGVKVAILNVVEREFSIAGENSPGANPLDLINVISDLESARQLVDKIILVVHGGLEHVPYPSPESVRLLRFLAEQKNVVAVIRHHPHIIQGVEWWKDVPIYYSLGNFYFPKKCVMPGGWNEGLLLTIEIGRNNIEVCHGRASVSDCKNGDFGMSMCDAGTLPEVVGDSATKFWQEVLMRRKYHYLSNVASPWTFWSRISNKFQVYRWLKLSRRQRLILKNYLLCPAHLEVLRHAVD